MEIKEFFIVIIHKNCKNFLHQSGASKAPVVWEKFCSYILGLFFRKF